MTFRYFYGMRRGTRAVQGFKLSFTSLYIEILIYRWSSFRLLMIGKLEFLSREYLIFLIVFPPTTVLVSIFEIYPQARCEKTSANPNRPLPLFSLRSYRDSIQVSDVALLLILTVLFKTSLASQQTTC